MEFMREAAADQFEAHFRKGLDARAPDHWSIIAP
jgi:hypothetical protein